MIYYSITSLLAPGLAPVIASLTRTNGDIKDGTVQVVTAANTGKISVTLPSGGTSGYTLLESGAELKLNSNINKTFQWTVSGGKITAAPTINESTGQISATTTTP